MSDKSVSEKDYPIQSANPTGVIVGTLSITDLEKMVLHIEDLELRTRCLRWLETALAHHEHKLEISEPLDKRSSEYYRSRY